MNRDQMKTPTEALKCLDTIEEALKNDSFIGFNAGYSLGSAVLYIREFLEETKNKTSP